MSLPTYRPTYLPTDRPTLKNGGVKSAVKKGAQGQGAMKILYTGGTAGPAIVESTRTTMSCCSFSVAPWRQASLHARLGGGGGVLGVKEGDETYISQK